jgi:hypothetical protein
VTPTVIPSRRRLLLSAASAALTALTCACLISAAALVPAPATVLPFLVVACVAGPMAATFDLASAVHQVNEPRAALRRELDRLPETPHPLGY